MTGDAEPTVDPGAAPARAGLTRRTLLTAALALPSAAWLPPASAAAPPALTVHPRSDWASGLPAQAAMPSERAGDVRLLLVHHSASSNSYRPDQVVGQLRSFFRFHTGGDKGWPDIAYNYLVDQFGGVWEGRTGSLDGPVIGSATGGTQGFDQLACYIGDLTSAPPTPAARTAMLALLAMLADRYAIDTAPGAVASFTSRGSNRWPAGASITTPTIEGHRAMSLTTCPGDAAYADLRATYQQQVSALRTSSAPPTPTATPVPSVPASSAPLATTSDSPPVAPPSGAPTGGSAGPPESGAGSDTAGTGLWAAGTAVTAAAVTGAVAVRQHRRGSAGSTGRS